MVKGMHLLWYHDVIRRTIMSSSTESPLYWLSCHLRCSCYLKFLIEGIKQIHGMWGRITGGLWLRSGVFAGLSWCASVHFLDCPISVTGSCVSWARVTFERGFFFRLRSAFLWMWPLRVPHWRTAGGAEMPRSLKLALLYFCACGNVFNPFSHLFIGRFTVKSKDVSLLYFCTGIENWLWCLWSSY